MIHNFHAETTFIKQEINFSDVPIFFPPKYEKIYLVAYIILSPYIAGMFFLFFYISSLKVDIFLLLTQDSSALFIWAIGYEILAFISLLYIFISSIIFVKKKSNAKNNIQKVSL